MSTLTEYIPDVIAYLLGQAQASQSLGAAASPVIIIDGPPTTQDVLVMNPNGLTQRLYIGGEGKGSPGEVFDSASSTQGFAFLDNARTRDDQIEVVCAAECGSGDAVMANARNGAFAVMAAIEVMLRGDLAYGPGDATMGALVQWSEVSGPIELQQQQSQDGAWALVKFRVSAFVRLTS